MPFRSKMAFSSRHYLKRTASKLRKTPPLSISITRSLSAPALKIQILSRFFHHFVWASYEMEPVVDKIKGFVKSSRDFVDGILHRSQNTSSRKPIEILKRLQRETFSDLMKLRDRQDKVERVLSIYKTSKGSPFQEASTNLRGEVDVLGAILMMSDTDQQHYDAIGRAGMNTGINSRFTFETTIRQKDTLVAQFAASRKGTEYTGDLSGGALTLSKVLYIANISDCCLAIAIPLGSQIRDLGMATSSSNEMHGLTNLSSVEPPLMNELSDVAFGLTVRKLNVTATLGHSVCGLGRQPFSDGIGHWVSTFGQIVYQLPRGIKFSLMGLQQVPKLSGQHFNLGALTIPLPFQKLHKTRETLVESSHPAVRMNTYETASAGSIALKMESELDESTRIRGWIEMKSSNPKHLHWAVSAYDDSEDDIGWGLSVGGIVEGPRSRSHLNAESYAKLNMGKKFSLKPGIACAVDDNARVFALMLRAYWSF